MREFIALFEEKSTVTLYRGDASSIEMFDIDKTDYDALLGMGLYLTDSPSIARDYTASKAADENVLFRKRTDQGEGARSKKDLIQSYLVHVMKTKYELDLVLQQYRADANGRFWNMDPAEKAARGDDFRGEFEAGQRKVLQNLFGKAKKDFEALRGKVRVTQLTTGEFVLTKADRPGVVTTFEVPADYLERTMHAERPLTDDQLAIVYKAFVRAAKGDEERPFDLRHYGSDSNGNKFWDFIEGYKKHGTYYAWTDHQLGGKGENPTLDFFWNGTHSGYFVFRDKERQQLLIQDLLNAGYTGLEYQGGVRLGGTGPRGLGGHMHRAFVLWDVEKANSFRVSTQSVAGDDEDASDIHKGVRAPTR
jgi:hypothetical protein